METMITGVRPTGSITLANYIGGIRKFVEQQYNYDSLIFIADIHGLTTYIEPNEIRNNILDITAMYMACGIDVEHTALFMQSDVLEHCNLGFLVAFQCGVGELSRMTQYKSKRLELGKNEKDMGFFIYPTLMAADILLYDPDYIPVGIDQKQHVELTRDLAIRFNSRYSDTFKVVEPVTAKTGAKINSLANPEKKMSKSESDKGTIYLLEDLAITRKKIMSAVTDSDTTIVYDMANKPGISNLLTIMSALTNESVEDIAARYNGLGYGTFKKAVADVVCKELEALQNKVKEIQASGIIDKVLEDGANKASYYARKKLSKVYRKVGLR